MGNVLSPVCGTIIVVDVSEEDTEQFRRTGPRFPRPRLQRLETNKRLAEGTLPPSGEIEVEEFEEAVTEVNTPVPRTSDRPTTAS